MDCHILPFFFFLALETLYPLKNVSERKKTHLFINILPNPGIEPESPALAGRFFTTAPPGMPIKKQYTDVKLFSNIFKFV